MRPRKSLSLRVWVSVQAQEINLRLRRPRRASVNCGFLERAFRIERKSWAVGVLVRVEQDVRPVIFVVTDSLALATDFCKE